MTGREKATSDPTDLQAYTVDESARTLKVHRATLWWSIWAGQIPTFRVGRRRLISAGTLRKIIAQGC